MWFMVYVKRRNASRSTATCNCTTNIHPVLLLKRWKEQAGEDEFALLFYDKLSDVVAIQAGEIDLGIYDYF